ncbi:MAG TPA: YbjN domain-containing protein [Kofleriaceae bacterium]|nr:YbjN domain-containing protein [Kofleriaceae bacterium]
MEPTLGIFDNATQTNLASTVTMVEDVLIELGHFVNECRVPAAGALQAWRVVKGSAVIRISLMEGNPYARLRIIAPVMTTDARVDVARLYRHLLNLNYTTLSGAAFATRQNEVVIIAERSALDLDRSEVKELIEHVQNTADHHDDLLVEEYGGRLGGIE